MGRRNPARYGAALAVLTLAAVTATACGAAGAPAGTEAADRGAGPEPETYKAVIVLAIPIGIVCVFGWWIARGDM